MTTAPVGIVVSESDPAAVRIGDALRGRTDWRKVPDASTSTGTLRRTAGAVLLTIPQRSLDCDGVAGRFRDAGHDPALVVFASRHAGETGPLLTAHHTGNAGPADHGGSPGTLAIPAPAATRRALRVLDRDAPDDYDVAMECTHHGPSEVGAPSLFVEVGSGPEQWRDGAAADAAAGAILALRDVDPHGRRAVAGFGGGHYAPRFGRVSRETPWAVGHVLADWSLDAMPDPSAAGRGVIEQAVRTTDAGYALVTDDRPAVRRAVEASGARVVSEDWLRAVADAPLPLVSRVEDVLGTIAGGVRLGDAAHPGGPTAPPSPDAIRTATLPAALVEEARGIDRDATRSAVAAHAVAYEADDAGVGTRVAVDASTADVDGVSTFDRICDGLVDVLRDGFDRVKRTADAIVVEREAFDPAAAADRGVPEGPAFGRLADGESVTVDGTTVEPEAVHRVERRRLPLGPPKPANQSKNK